MEKVLDVVFGVLLFFFVFGLIIGAAVHCVDEAKAEKELGTESYEIVIVDKYECLGSSFHLIGGRATETEYHLVYNYRCTNRPKDKNLSEWKSRNAKVNHSTWSKYNIGEKRTRLGTYYL